MIYSQYNGCQTVYKAQDEDKGIIHLSVKLQIAALASLELSPPTLKNIAG